MKQYSIFDECFVDSFAGGCGRELESFKRLEGEHWCEECRGDKDNEEQ